MLEPYNQKKKDKQIMIKITTGWMNRGHQRGIFFTDVIEKYTFGNGRMIIREVCPPNND